MGRGSGVGGREGGGRDARGGPARGNHNRAANFHPKSIQLGGWGCGGWWGGGEGRGAMTKIGLANGCGQNRVGHRKSARPWPKAAKATRVANFGPNRPGRQKPAQIGQFKVVVKIGLAKVGRGQSRSWPKKVVAKKGRGQKRSWPKKVVAKKGHSPLGVVAGLRTIPLNSAKTMPSLLSRSVRSSPEVSSIPGSHLPHELFQQLFWLLRVSFSKLCTLRYQVSELRDPCSSSSK